MESWGVARGCGVGVTPRRGVGVALGVGGAAAEESCGSVARGWGSGAPVDRVWNGSGGFCCVMGQQKKAPDILLDGANTKRKRAT